jgi:hypothetical protein
MVSEDHYIRIIMYRSRITLRDIGTQTNAILVLETHRFPSTRQRKALSNKHRTPTWPGIYNTTSKREENTYAITATESPRNCSLINSTHNRGFKVSDKKNCAHSREQTWNISPWIIHQHWKHLGPTFIRNEAILSWIMHRRRKGD